MENHIIFHIDVNSAFLSWEAADRLARGEEGPDLRDIPAIVGGDRERRHGVVLAKSVPAKKFGVRTGEPIAQALKKCPELTIVPPRRGLYERCSAQFLSILEQYSPNVEQYSIDEAFMDMTGMQELFGESKECAYQLKERIKRELGITVNVGISTNKLLAKMAGDLKKPDMVHTLFPSELKQKMWPLPVEDLLFVGRATAQKLHLLGIHTIGELAVSDPRFLHTHLKSTGDMIWQFANGIDDALVRREAPAAKGYSNETTLAHDVTDAREAKEVLLYLVEKVAVRLRQDGRRAEVVCVGLKDAWFVSMSHQKVLPNPTSGTKELYGYACQLFDELWDGRPLRLLSFYVSRLTEDEMRQLQLFDTTDYEKQEKAERAMDAIREKFGSDAIKRAVFLKPEQEEK